MATTEALNRFLARQPILTAKKKFFAYEILSRYGAENYCRQTGTKQFHVNGMDELFLMGITTMTEGMPAFLNCTREFLANDYLTLMPRGMVVGEILETVAADEEVMTACRRMKEQGYRLALDDYCDVQEVRPLMDFADYVKIDVLMTSFEEQKRLVGKVQGAGDSGAGGESRNGRTVPKMSEHRLRVVSRLLFLQASDGGKAKRTCE